MSRSISLQETRPGVLVVRKSRGGSAFALVFYASFLVLWYKIALSNEFSVLLVLHYVVPLLFLPTVVRSAKAVFLGESVVFDSAAGLIVKQGTRLASFSDVDRVQIRTFHNSKGSDEHRLAVVMRDGNKVKIEQSTHHDEICEIADRIGDLMNVDVVRKK